MPKRVDSQHSFAMIPRAEIARSLFKRDRGLKTTLNSGFLIPIFVDECLPGDTLSVRASAFGRMSTLLFPIMEDLVAEFFFFACPNRLVWDNWQRFMGEQRSPGDSTDFEVPQMVAPAGGHTELSLADYFGIPTKVVITHSALMHRMYNLVYQEWFRDENLQDGVVVDLDDGPDNPADYVLRRRGKRHDYFTASLPFLQKGPAVELPLGLSAPVSISPLGDGRPTFETSQGSGKRIRGSETEPIVALEGSVNASGSSDWMEWTDPKLQGEADLSAATAATINQIRQAFQVQRLLERDARGGTRYTEIVRSHFGVVSDDARLQRPEFLGGGRAQINVNPVAVTSDVTRDIAELAAFATLSGSGIGFSKSFTEHSLVLGLVSIRADLSYQQGLDRMWSRRSRLDYFWPALAHLGEQAVLSQEIYADGTGDPVAGTGDFSVWGYQERYAEYRYAPSKVTGHMRSNSATPLDGWHLVQDFATRPLLNDVFIEENPPVGRVSAVPSEAEFLLDMWFKVRHARPMPVYSVPGLIDHF